MRRIRLAATVAVITNVLGFAPVVGSAMEPEKSQGFNVEQIRLADEPRYQGKTLSYWVKILRDQDEELISVAFEAIRNMGPDAWPAIPELTRIVAAPFAPIQIDKDSDELIACKLFDIE